MGPQTKLRWCIWLVKMKGGSAAILSIITFGAFYQEESYFRCSGAAAFSLHLKWFQQTQLGL